MDVPLSLDDPALVDRLRALSQRLLLECSKSIVGQREVLEQLLIALFAQGHCLLVGVPGLAKTLMIRTLADALDLSFSRIQFTPDLMPSDITGTDILQDDPNTGRRTFQFLRGPMFANVVLADEINRTPPKTQAALLEAMQEKQITVGGNRHRLPEPFFVLATQNPIEQEGTYPLPEAQLDRFMLDIRIGYPSEQEEYDIVERTTTATRPRIERVLTIEELTQMQELVRRIPAAPHVIRYAMNLARATRRDHGEVPDFIREYVTWGAGPRASQNLVLAAKARAALYGRPYTSTADVQAMAPAVLRHRIITNFNAEADRVRPDDLVRRLLDYLPRPDENDR